MRWAWARYVPPSSHSFLLTSVQTLQTISFSAYLREQGNFKPFLVVCPLSVMHNWIAEYEKFAPSIPVCMYHGTPEERATLRRTVMAHPSVSLSSAPKAKRGRKSKKSAVDEVANTREEDFPVVVTTYDMVIRDRAHLSKYNWGYIVVDEGHRLKNLNCKLMQELTQYTSAGRMILTGTPLQNNLRELWSLLHFAIPEIFKDVEAFEELFNLTELQDILPTEQSTQIITTLHAILKPFLLRRMKVDVEMNLPPKKEYVLYAPLSVRQREAYDRILNGGFRKWLIEGGTIGGEEGKAVAKQAEALRTSPRKAKVQDGKRVLRERDGTKHYDLDGDDDEYFEALERGEVDHRGRKQKLTKAEEDAKLARALMEHQNRQKSLSRAFRSYRSH